MQKITTSVDFKSWMKRLDNQLNEPNKQNSSLDNEKENVVIKFCGQV